jgi:hypothetical protein
VDICNRGEYARAYEVSIVGGSLKCPFFASANSRAAALVSGVTENGGGSKGLNVV